MQSCRRRLPICGRRDPSSCQRHTRDSASCAVARAGRTKPVALFEQAGSHPLALLGGAWVDIEQRNLTRALERAGAYLRRFPEDAVLERAPANELLVRIAAASGKLADAQRPLAELEKATQKYERQLLRAALLSAKAILANADGDDARAAAVDGRRGRVVRRCWLRSRSSNGATRAAETPDERRRHA
jgi:ATP/maltotriose-dependent transcriptional regulator MalT